jgi:hypothetical protein
MKNQLPPLSTPDSEAGLVLASQLADSLHAQVEQSGIKEKWLGGMNYLPSKDTPERDLSRASFSLPLPPRTRVDQQSLNPERMIF